MKYLLTAALILLPLSANASSPSSIDKYPKGCQYSCDGWLFNYSGKQADHRDSLSVFVWSSPQQSPHDKEEWAKNIIDAQKIADEKAKKVGL